MTRNIILNFKVRYYNHTSDIEYEIEKKKDNFCIHRTNHKNNVSHIETISETSILHALNESNDIDELVSKIKMPSF